MGKLEKTILAIEKILKKDVVTLDGIYLGDEGAMGIFQDMPEVDSLELEVTGEWKHSWDD